MQKVRREDLREFVQGVLRQLRLPDVQGTRATVIALSGDLGSGKTTFTQALAKELGVQGVVQSPTYVLMKSYPLDHARGKPLELNRFTKLIHIDAYRLTTPDEFSTLDPEMFLHDPHALVVVEWPERLEGMLPKPDLVLNFSSQDAGEGERYIEVV